MLLIADLNHTNAETMANIFYYMGILAYPTSYDGAYREIGRKYHTYLLLEPERGNNTRELVEAIRNKSELSSVFGVSFRGGEFYGHESAAFSSFDTVFRCKPLAAPLLASITDYQRLHGHRILGDYKICGLRAENYSSCVHCSGGEITLTKTELMIIRYLCCTYPEPTDARDILKYAFRFAKVPELANIRTHISVINRKFCALYNKPLIHSEPRIGYTLTAPESDTEAPIRKLTAPV